MTYAGLASGFVVALLFAGAMEAQQARLPFNPVQTEIQAERAAGSVLLEAGERYLNAGFSGPDSKPCRLISSALQHLKIAAAAANEPLPLAARNEKLLSVACRAQ
jgi:hypothetical protein